MVAVGAAFTGKFLNWMRSVLGLLCCWERERERGREGAERTHGVELDEGTNHAGAESALLVWRHVEGHYGLLPLQ